MNDSSNLPMAWREALAWDQLREDLIWPTRSLSAKWRVCWVLSSAWG
jgi:hypothetical protein